MEKKCSDKKDLNVIVMNDMCSYGKVSLTVNIPVLSAFSVKVSPLPTVLLSNHTQFSSFCAFDMTEYLFPIVEELKKRNAVFDAFYIGWLGKVSQVDLAVSIIKDFNIPLTVVDPILGDNETLYSSITDEQVSNMKKLIKHADIIVPNTTEFSALLGLPIDKKPSIETIKENIKTLKEYGPKNIVVTSVEEGDNIGTLCYCEDGSIFTHLLPKLPIHTPGTGDAFGSSLLGYLLKGDNLETATKKATNFLHEAVTEVSKTDIDRSFGIPIENYLHLL